MLNDHSPLNPKLNRPEVQVQSEPNRKVESAKHLPQWIGRDGAIRETDSRKSRWCLDCGYPILEEADAGRCSECGRSFPPFVTPISAMDESSMAFVGLLIVAASLVAISILQAAIARDFGLAFLTLTLGLTLMATARLVRKIRLVAGHRPSRWRCRLERAAAACFPFVQFGALGCAVLGFIWLVIVMMLGWAFSVLSWGMP